MRSPNDEGSQFSKFHFPWNKEEKLVSNSFFREYNLYFKKSLNPFKVVYHLVSCLLHLHIGYNVSSILKYSPGATYLPRFESDSFHTGRTATKRSVGQLFSQSMWLSNVIWLRRKLLQRHNVLNQQIDSPLFEDSWQEVLLGI